MNGYKQHLNLVDLVSEQHQVLRTLVRNKWNERYCDDITQTESHILAIVETENITVAEIARKINISRQAVHKSVQNLISRKYLDVRVIEGNQRDKLIILTEKGEEACKNMLAIKEEIENHIIMTFGQEKIKALKENLRENWLNNFN